VTLQLFAFLKSSFSQSNKRYLGGCCSSRASNLHPAYSTRIMHCSADVVMIASDLIDGMDYLWQSACKLLHIPYHVIHGYPKIPHLTLKKFPVGVARVRKWSPHGGFIHLFT
jgi:hypothetical protein